MKDNTTLPWLTIRHAQTIGVNDLSCLEQTEHHLLLDKFRLLDICGPLIDWIADLLIDRDMRVSGIRIRFMDVWGGVSQGSVLGPLLFLLFIIIYLLMLFLNVNFLLMIKRYIRKNDAVILPKRHQIYKDVKEIMVL